MMSSSSSPFRALGRFLAIGILALALPTLAACERASSGGPQSSTYDRVLETGVIRAAYITYPPAAMRDPETGGPHTAHTTNPVPVLLAGAPSGTKLAEGRLADLAPTLLALMQIEQPPEMTGRSLLR